MSIWMWLLFALCAMAMVMGVRDTIHQRGKGHRAELAQAWETGYARATHPNDGLGIDPYEPLSPSWGSRRTEEPK